MTWILSEDVEEFARHTMPHLVARPVQNTLVISVLQSVRADRRYSSEPVLCGWYDEGDEGGLVGAVLMTPPFELILAMVPEPTVPSLVSALRARGVTLPGVNGDADVVEAFAARWTAETSLTSRIHMHMRLFRLDRLRSPQPAPEGRGRLAASADGEVLVEWLRAFQAEAMPGGIDAPALVADRTEQDLLWLWEDGAGRPVSMAGRQRTVAGVSRIGPVYTPPAHRRQGYGSAVTAAATADALQRGADEVALFTDQSNPTSNAIYQNIGFRPVVNRLVVRFGVTDERAGHAGPRVDGR
ncbi:MAG: hypothetical protein QOI06_3250 [Nocardioidaceae bacterium]|nr:hypothetical protein [Nocardioidaceae bacterium]